MLKIEVNRIKNTQAITNFAYFLPLNFLFKGDNLLA